MSELQYFKSFLGELLAIDAVKFLRPAMYYGSNTRNLYQMYILGQSPEGFTIKNPHPTFSWQKAKIVIPSDQKENRILLIEDALDVPVFTPFVPVWSTDPVFHFLPSTRAVHGFWKVQDRIVCITGLEYYKNDVKTVRVYVGREGEMRQLRVDDYKGTTVVVEGTVLDIHLKTIGGYSLSPLNIHEYTVTESENGLDIKKK